MRPGFVAIQKLFEGIVGWSRVKRRQRRGKLIDDGSTPMFSLWKRAYIAEKGAGVHAYNRCYYSVSDGSVRPFRSFKALPGSKRSFVQTNQQPRNTFSIIVSFRNEFEENDSGSFYGSVEHNSSYHDFAEICAAAARQENLDKSHCSRPPTVTLHHRSKTILQCTQMDLHKYVCVR